MNTTIAAPPKQFLHYNPNRTDYSVTPEELACEWTYAALKEIRDEIKEHFGLNDELELNAEHED